MAEPVDRLSVFTTRVRQLMLEYTSLQSENASLRQRIAELEAASAELSDRLKQSEADFRSLKTARMLEVSDGDVEAARRRLSALARQVDSCITMLSEE